MSRPRYYILDENGDPVRCDDIVTFARWFEKADLNIAETVVGELRISTIFLGLDPGIGPLLLYETMVFHKDELYPYQERYATRVQALAGHERAVQWARQQEDSAS